MLPRAGWVLETRLHKLVPSVSEEMVSGTVGSNHGSQAYEEDAKLSR